MARRIVSNQLELAWATVYQRGDQLAWIDDRLLPLEATITRKFDRMRDLAAEGDDLGEVLDEAHAAGPEFAWWGEAALMFGESALNRLADTVAETRVPDERRAVSLSFGELIKQTENSADGTVQKLAPFLGQMRRARVQVVLPRHVMSVHPPAGRFPDGYSYRPDERLRLVAPRTWPPDSTLDAAKLRDELTKDLAGVTLPKGIEGELLAREVVEEAGDRLGSAGYRALLEYERVHGSSASPGVAIELTRGLIEDCGSALGFPPLGAAG